MKVEWFGEPSIAREGQEGKPLTTAAMQALWDDMMAHAHPIGPQDLLDLQRARREFWQARGEDPDEPHGAIDALILSATEG